MKKLICVFLLVSFLFSMYSLAFGDENQSSKAFISAQTRVRGLAIKSENTRKSNGIIAGSIGALMSVFGLYYMSRPTSAYDLSPMFGVLFLGEGLAFAGMGAALYFIPSGIENDFANIEKISLSEPGGASEREALSENTLKKRSEEAENGRHFGGMMLGGLGLLIASTGGGSGAASGLLYGGLGWYSYNNKTDVEKEYDEYSGSKEIVGKQLQISSLEAVGNSK